MRRAGRAPSIWCRERPQAALFAAASVWTAVGVPLWLVLRESGCCPAGRIVAADWHGYEMLFGFALAVVAGFLIGPVPRIAARALVGIWLIARLGALLAPFGLVHAASSAAFAAGVAVLAAPKLLRGPSKLRNRVFGPVVVLLCVDAAIAPFGARWREPLLLAGLDLYLVMLAFMGGRLIAAAAAGRFYRRGSQLDARVQPWIEAPVLVLLLALAVCDLVSAKAWVGSAVATAAAVLLFARWLRWRLWTCLDAWNLTCLGLGYLWLPLGLAIRASRSLPLWLLPTDALHGLTAGAVGSLTLLVMGRTRAMTRGADPERSRTLVVAAALVHVAAVLRLLAGTTGSGARAGLLLVAGSAWAAAFTILVFFLGRLELLQIGTPRNTLPRGAERKEPCPTKSTRLHRITPQRCGAR